MQVLTGVVLSSVGELTLITLVAVISQEELAELTSVHTYRFRICGLSRLFLILISLFLITLLRGTILAARNSIV